MIEHHEDAVEIAKLSADNARHPEIKQLSEDIIKTQSAEIEQLMEWRQEWNYTSASGSNSLAPGHTEH